LRSSSDGKDLTDAIEAGDEDSFLEKLQAYDQMSKLELDKWKTAMFFKVKEGIDAEPDLTQLRHNRAVRLFQEIWKEPAVRPCSEPWSKRAFPSS